VPSRGACSAATDYSEMHRRMKPTESFGRPHEKSGTTESFLILPPTAKPREMERGFATFATRTTSACGVVAETSNPRCAGEPAATRRVALRSRIPTGFRPEAQGCEARATLGHRPTSIPNRKAVEAHPFPPARLTSAITPLALILFPNAHPR